MTSASSCHSPSCTRLESVSVNWNQSVVSSSPSRLCRVLSVSVMSRRSVAEVRAVSSVALEPAGWSLEDRFGNYG